jgi:CRISPR/Cas system Type II protein with McrA/HNH and RuvC-like nuclease domain
VIAADAERLARTFALAKLCVNNSRGGFETIMTNDDMEKRIEFIIEQQAQFSVDIQQLRESQSETNQIVNRLAAVTLEGFKDVNAKIDALVDAQIRADANMNTMNEALLNVIAVVDRYFRGLNGNAES